MDDNELKYWDSYQYDYSPVAFDSENSFDCYGQNKALSPYPNSHYNPFSLTSKHTSFDISPAIHSQNTPNKYLYPKYKFCEYPNLTPAPASNNSNLLSKSFVKKSSSEFLLDSVTCHSIKRHKNFSHAIIHPPDSICNFVPNTAFCPSNQDFVSSSTATNKISNSNSISRNSTASLSDNLSKNFIQPSCLDDNFNTKFKHFALNNNIPSQPKSMPLSPSQSNHKPLDFQSFSNPVSSNNSLIQNINISDNLIHVNNTSLTTKNSIAISSFNLISPPIHDQSNLPLLSSPIDPVALQMRLRFLQNSIEEQNRLSNQSD
ncbi:hypothetical protein BB561_004888 [Smittium simulii]|uniref:Uncharacterized protein n=1 Tax=Smittium simulii TaxID=133385 RepID=A0A2T9YDQ3_9FUNG|nr:hypothetical protein BB561_004888 [Smittium simulii]